MAQARKLSLIGLPLVMILAGCASSYAPPSASTPSARLRVFKLGTDNIKIQKLQNACLTTDKNARNFGTHYETIETFSAVSTPGRLGMPDPPAGPGKFSEITVDATQPFNLGYDMMWMVSGYPANMVYTCVTGISFKPVAGADYEAVISRSDTNQCRLELFRLTPSEGKTVRAPVDDAQRIVKRCS